MFYPISDNWHLGLNRQSQQLSFIALAYHSKGRGFESAGWNIFFLQCRISELWCRYRNTSDIGMTFFSPTYLSPISEEQMSMSDVGYRRHWDRCRCPPMFITSFIRYYSSQISGYCTCIYVPTSSVQVYFWEPCTVAKHLLHGHGKLLGRRNDLAALNMAILYIFPIGGTVMNVAQ
jgi:hypothetical protein